MTLADPYRPSAPKVLRHRWGSWIFVTPDDPAMWWAHQDSNLEPRDYESRALTIEL